MTQPRQGRGRRGPREGPAAGGQGQRRPGAPPTCSEDGVLSSRGGGDVCTSPEIGARARRGWATRGGSPGRGLCHPVPRRRGDPQDECVPNCSEQTFRVLQDLRGARKLRQAAAELSAMGQPATTTISPPPKASQGFPALCDTSAETCPVPPGEPQSSETKRHLEGPRSRPPGTPLHASNTTQARWGGGTEGNPSKTRPHLDDARSPTAQRVTAMPGSCQRCHQQPRLQARVSPHRQRLPQRRASSAKQPRQWIRTRQERHRIPQHPEPRR